MDLLEHQGKDYFARYGIPVPPGAAVDTPDEAVRQANRLGYPVVLKAQVPVGGRGKAGGIRVAADADEARDHAGDILGMTIGGHTVQQIRLEPAAEIAREYYASFTLDRAAKKFLAMVSARGGVDIEQVAAESPEAVVGLHVDPSEGFDEHDAVRLVREAGLDPRSADAVADLLQKLYRCFVEGDADLVEINPLVVTASGAVYALDAKVALDENAAFRHPEWAEFAGAVRQDPREALAAAKKLQYVGLDGFVGIMANGAGLGLCTCDVVNQAGGRPANFLDPGGGSGADVIADGLEVINADPGVRSILINVFGGITSCEEVARGILEAMRRVEISAPIVIRLDGTHAEEGRALLRRHESTHLVTRATMLDAAREAVALAHAAGSASVDAPEVSA